MRLAGDEEGKGKGSKGNGNGNVRVVGEEGGKVGKAMVMATRLVGKWMMTATKRAMATKMREVGKK
jgi:hypothetical protein